jgi:hypothetical protein
MRPSWDGEDRRGSCFENKLDFIGEYPELLWRLSVGHAALELALLPLGDPPEHTWRRLAKQEVFGYS